MRILRDLQNVIASEYYKTRHDVAAKLFLFFPVLLTVAFIVYDLWNLSREGYDGTNLWIYNIGRTLFMFYGMLYPLMAALFCAAYIGKEFKNDNYLLLFLFPVPRGTVYVAKLIYLLSMTFLSVLIAYVAFMLSRLYFGRLFTVNGLSKF
ncbi:ABC transporter permease [Bacteroides fragilis]|nr:ABC transporter permease [Bacteroides fragilis]